MATLLQQETQIRASLTADRVDTIAPSEANFETNAVSLLDDINNICSQLSNLMDNQAGDWFTDLVTPSTLDTGTQRGVNDLNTDLHAIEKKRVAREVHNLTDVTVGGADDFVILAAGELPANTTAAVGAVTTLGTIVAAHGGTFGTHALAEVAGNSALNPQNLVTIVDGASRDPILSGGRKIYGLLQGEAGLTDGTTITDTTTTRVQISFVRQNAGGNDLEAVPAADIQGLTVNYSSRERVRLEDLNEQDFLTGAIVDVGAGAGTIDLQTAFNNQGTTPVDVTTNTDIDLEGPGLEFCFRDDLEADLLCIKEGSAGGTSEVQIGAATDVFNNDAIVNDFAAGATLGSGLAAPIAVGVNSGQIATTAGDLQLDAFALLAFGDGFELASTYDTPLVLSDSSAEWDAFDAAFGEVSLLAAIVAAAGGGTRRRVFAVATADVAAGVDIVNPTNIDAALGDLSTGTFVDDYDFYHNGQYLRIDAAAAGPGDIYPGTSLAAGQVKLNRKLKTGDTIAMIDLA